MAHADAALHQLKAVMEKESLQKLQSVQAAVQRKEAELQVCLMHTELLWGLSVWLVQQQQCNRSVVCACSNHHLKALLEALMFAPGLGTVLSALCCRGQMSCTAGYKTATCVFWVSQKMWLLLIRYADLTGW